VRLDIPWLRRKTKRRVRFFIGFLPGAILINIIGRLVPPHRTLITVLTALWAGYWWMVMTAGQSARAWTPPETTQMPWYLRAWFKLNRQGVPLPLGPAALVGADLGSHVAHFHGPAERVEEQPLEFAGLSLSRALVLIPWSSSCCDRCSGVRGALLVEHASTARLPIPVTAAEVAEAAAHAPDAEAGRTPASRPRSREADSAAGSTTRCANAQTRRSHAGPLSCSSVAGGADDARIMLDQREKRPRGSRRRSAIGPEAACGSVARASTPAPPPDGRAPETVLPAGRAPARLPRAVPEPIARPGRSGLPRRARPVPPARPGGGAPASVLASGTPPDAGRRA
jgi:hypothetical protein